MSRIRTNLITNRMANGAPTVSNGLVIAGVTTVTTLDLNGDLDVDGHLNADNVSIAGVVTATSFVGSGANLTGITQTTINNNADNKIITGSGTANTLEAESTLLYSNPNLEINTDTSAYASVILNGNSGGLIQFEDNEVSKWQIFGDSAFNIYDDVNNASRLYINSSGQMGLSGTPTHKLEIFNAADTENILMIRGADTTTEYAAMGVSGGNAVITGGGVGSTNAGISFRTAASGTEAERLRITSDGHTLFSGLTTKNDPRNTNGITVKSTAGVSFQNYGSNGSRNWRIRPDDLSRWGDLDFSVSPTANSATDWPDATADKVLTLGYDGTVLKPRNPLFVAQKSSVISGTGYVTFNTVIENVGSHYDSSNGRFTAPVAGYYWFCVKINAYKRIDWHLVRNGTTSGNTNREIGQYNTSNQDGWYSHNMVRVFELAANDYVQVYVAVIQQNSDPGEWLTFQGYLLQ